MSTMSLPAESIRQCADELAKAEHARRPIQPPREVFTQLNVTDAYRVQLANIQRRTLNGERVIGHKVGLTARTMQELFGVSEPDYGHLLDTMMHAAGRPLDLSELIDPQIEVEPAFILRTDLEGPGLSIDQVIAAIECVIVCFEVIDSRIVDWRIGIQDTVADNGSSARVVLGSQRVNPRDIDLANLDTVLELDGVAVEHGNTSAILGHPARSVAWLAGTVAHFGMKLKAGDLILPGTCTRSRRIAGHKSVTGRIAGLGDVTVALANAPTVKQAG